MFATGLGPLAAQTSGSADIGDTLGGGADEGVGQQVGEHGATFTLYYRDDMQVTSSLEGSPGRSAECGHYEIVAVGTPDNPEYRFDISPVNGALVVGEYYLLYCWEPGGLPVIDGIAGYPVGFACCSEPGAPGADLVDSWDLVHFAAGNVGFDEPSIALSPATDQIVGVPTWLAVTSRLDFAPVAATAGALWARATPVFDRAVWEFDDGAPAVECDAGTDVATVWDPDLGDDQVSRCVHTFLTNGAGEPFAGQVTVHWAIYFESSITGGAVENGGTLQYWGRWSESLAVTVNVRELQAVID